MKHILFIAVFSALIGLVACGDKQVVTDVLNRAETLMDEHPDSSLVLLRTLTFDDFRKESNRARYALLHSQALDKNYIDVTSDSLISVAVEYYKDKDDVRGKFLSYYYMGRVHANGERYLQATSCLMESEQLVDEVGDDYLSGLLYSEMGRIYEIYYDFPKSLEAYQKAAECYERVGKIRHRNYMWLNQSLNYRNLREYDECEHLLKMALESAIKEDDSELLKSCFGDLIMLYVNQSRLIEAKELYEKLKVLTDFRYDSSSFMGKLAKMYALEGKLSQAMELIVEGWKQAENKTDSANLFIAAAEVYSLQGKGEAAYRELLKGVVCQNEDAYQALRHPVLTAQRDYLSDKLEFEAYKLRTEKHLRVLYIIVFSLLLVAVVWILLRKLKVTKENARKTIDGLHAEMLRKDKESREEVDILLQELEQKDRMTADTIGKLRLALKHQEENSHQYVQQMEEMEKLHRQLLSHKTTHISELFKAWFGVMDKWMMLYREEETKGSSKLKRLGREVTIFEEKYFVGNKAYGQLEKLLNAYHDNVMFHFRREVELSDETDYRRVCYFFAGFSPDTIAWLMDEKTENVYQRRLRLRKNISLLAPLHKDLFLLLLGK